MKSGIHPTWNHQATVKCACGNTFTTGSTLDNIEVDICSACHPFFTGEMKFVDRQGRVDRFIQKMQAAQAKQATSQKKSAKGKVSADEAKSYQEILREQRSKLRPEKSAAAAAATPSTKQ